ncbi:hypothetical protein ACFWD7_01950 [Streptomyces mirabilis]|nr:hypothetical protein [Streptomyces mirabilis]MCT9109032.1 hypothetical protein [Streptomyces mirabilis]
MCDDHLLRAAVDVRPGVPRLVTRLARDGLVEALAALTRLAERAQHRP